MGGGGSIQNMINAMKYNKAILRGKNHFKNIKNSRKYAPKRKLKRGDFTDEQVQNTIQKHREIRELVLRKRRIALCISLTLLIGLLYVLNERFFF